MYAIKYVSIIPFDHENMQIVVDTFAGNLMQWPASWSWWLRQNFCVGGCPYSHQSHPFFVHYLIPKSSDAQVLWRQYSNKGKDW